MKKTYLKLTNIDRAKLKKLADSKSLSMSTTANIIIKHLYCWIKADNYIQNPNCIICVKLKNENKLDLNTMINSNCIHIYFNTEKFAYCQNEKVNKKLLESIKKQIQSELDKTYDPNAIKNQIIRATYNINKGIQK